MDRIYKVMDCTGKPAREIMQFSARGPQDAIKKSGLDDPIYEITYSRKGYGYFTGRIELRAPETVSASQGLRNPLPADFVILAV